ncbi:uncharacterized protein LOC105392971 [Plutella xylostella]|uniref:uncharacterized protein LOC105392971 n=1 Tax=Plutella xylostella TaxID=51655 RepID=UPI002032E999|nr:uncharacterized protein LOC105392971 [Plutella xylostella]
MSLNDNISFCVSLMLLAGAVLTLPQNMQDLVGFPETEEVESDKNKEGRQPIYAPVICAENELYYPGDQKDDWICDCRPAFLYHPTTDACWPAYRKGPCSQGEYLVLKSTSVIPVCVRNPCYGDNFVVWNAKCVQLGTTEPCALFSRRHPSAKALGVNATTLAVSCLDLALENRFGEAPAPTTVKCLPGSKRNVDNKCG